MSKLKGLSGNNVTNTFTATVTTDGNVQTIERTNTHVLLD